MTLLQTHVGFKKPINFTVLEKDSRGFENVLVIMNVFTKFTFAVPTREEGINSCYGSGGDMVSLHENTTKDSIRRRQTFRIYAGF